MADIEIDYEGAREVRRQRLIDAFERSVEIDGRLTAFAVIKAHLENIADARGRLYSARFGDSA